jgi:hypothetical protein
MRQHQPLRQVPRRFVWRRSVERHHRRWKTRRATKLRAPSVADGHDLDVVRTPANGFVEAMDCHVCLVSREVKRWQFYALTFRDQAKRVAKPAQHMVIGTVSRGSSEKIFFHVRFSTGFALSVHSFSTTSVPVAGAAQVKCCIA